MIPLLKIPWTLTLILFVAAALHLQEPRPQKEIVAEIQKAGGKVEYDDKIPGRPVVTVNY